MVLKRDNCDFRTVRGTPGSRRRINPAVSRSKLRVHLIQCHGAGAYCSLPRPMFLSSDTVCGICEVGEMYAWRNDFDALATSSPIREFNSPIPAFHFHFQMTQKRVGVQGRIQQGMGGKRALRLATPQFVKLV